jgi:type II secretory pathway component PulC
MRLVATLAVGLLACAPKVAPNRPVFEHDLDGVNASVAQGSDTAAPVAPRVEAPRSKGVRTGTIERAKLLTVLDGGPGEFLRQFEVTARMDGERFVGWQLVQLVDHKGPLAEVDLMPGDVLLDINGQPLSRPDQLQTVWDSLRQANDLTADLWRGNDKLSLHFAIEPRL